MFMNFQLQCAGRQGRQSATCAPCHRPKTVQATTCGGHSMHNSPARPVTLVKGPAPGLQL